MISWKQAFVLIFLGYMMVALTYIPNDQPGTRNSDKLLSISLTMVIVFISFAPIYFLTRRNKGCNIIDCVNKNTPVLTKPVAFIYVLAFLYAIVVTTARFSLFITSVLLVESKSVIFIVIILAAACYAAYLGIEAISRASLFVFGALVFSMILLCFMLSSEINILNLRPLFYDGVGEVFYGAAIDATKIIEVAALGILAPSVKGGIKKTIIVFVILFWFVISVITFFMVSILGEYGSVQMFPVYTMVSLGKIGTFRRFDAILTSVWIVGDFIKDSLLIIVMSECMRYVFKGKKLKVAISVNIVTTLLATVFISYSMDRYLAISDYRVLGAIVVAVSLFIPLVFLIVDIIKKRKADSLCENIN